MKTFVLILFVGLVSTSWAQNAINDQEVLVRVDCREKKNQWIGQLPEVLLKAFQNGEIKAYYPMDRNKEMSFEAFLTHFGMPLPEVRMDDTPSCGTDLPLQVDPWEVNCLSMSFDIKQRMYFDTKMSQQKRDIEFIQMIYSHECSVTELEYYGPVFKYKDVARLSDRLVNPENSSVRYTPKKMMEMHLYTVTMIKKGENDYYEKPAVQGQNEQMKNAQKEMEMWDY